MTYTWKVTGVKAMDLPGEPDAIIQTYWTKTGTDSEGKTGTFTGATPFSPELIDHDSFIPFEELTEETVLGWIKEIVVGSYEEHVNAQIQKEIDKTKIKDQKLPWAPEPEPATEPGEGQ
jgi:hypothetical protein